MNKFKVNGKEYNAKVFDFNLVCDLEDMGISLATMGTRPMSMARAYFGLCSGLNTDMAGKEIEAHMIGGGSLTNIIEAMTKEMDKSDFFRSLTQNAEKKIAEDQKEKK